MISEIIPYVTSLVLISSAPQCPERPPILTFKTKVEKTQYVKDYSSEEITKQFLSRGGQVSSDSIVRGTASPQIKIDYDIEPEVLTTRSGHICGYAKKVDILLTASPVIHMANEYEFGSCEYKEIIKHENQHVKISEDLIRDYRRTVKRDLTDRIRDISGHRAVDVSYREKLSEAIVQGAKIVIKQVEAELRQEHAKRQAVIDTQEEYARIQSRCITWQRLD